MGHQHDKNTFLLLVAVGCACFFYLMYFCFGDAVSVPYAVGGNARPNVGKRLRHLAPAPVGRVGTWMNNRSSVKRTLDRGEDGDGPSYTDAPAITAAPSGRVPQEYASVVNKTWIKWTEANSPASYCACVPRPQDSVSMSEVVTGGLVEQSPSMNITHCVRKCITLNFTYAALSRGIECFCSAVQGESPLLTYTEHTHCDIPCSGQLRYHCGGKEFMSLYRTSVPDHRCSEAVLRPRGSLPLIALASYPRSGNTWTRQLIERATGILTGSVYWQGDRSKRFYKTIFPGGNIDFRRRQTICVKSHQILGPIRQFQGAVLLIRNPYHTLVAEEFRRDMLQDGHKSVEEVMDFFNSTDWRTFAGSAADEWMNTAVNWIRNMRRIHVVHYENLRENTYEELAKIVRFLGVPVQKERLLCATQEHPSSKLTGIALGNYGEKTWLYLTEDPFPLDIRKLVEKNIEIVNATLLRHNLTPLPRDYSVEVF